MASVSGRKWIDCWATAFAQQKTVWRYCLACGLLIGFSISINYLKVMAQEPNRWLPQQTIPNYHPETAESPTLIADQNRTVHAFSHQQVGDGEKEIAIVYNRWTLENGWSQSVDIMLSPIKHHARLLGVTLDNAGLFHLLFFGGDEAESNVYYTSAIAATADSARSWSQPIAIGQDAMTPENGGIIGDGQGNLVVLYSGNAEGNGWYTAVSTDSGSTWTEPFPFFATQDDELTPYYLRLTPGQTGVVHAIWSVNDVLNHGVAIYYASFSYADLQWREPLRLAETQGGLGVLAPALIEHQGTLFGMYYEGTTGKEFLLRSEDGGQRWTEPTAPFPHVGLNGPGFFVVDAHQTLHFFWGQRITGTPDIHGLWHTTWQNGQWSPWDAIVSGPRVSDLVGNEAFDPITPFAVARQGNVLLVVWRSDYGLKANGIWYSYKTIDAPELPTVVPAALPVLLPTQSTPVAVSAVSHQATVTALPVPLAKPLPPRSSLVAPTSGYGPAGNLLMSLAPPIVLVGLTLLIRRFLRHR